MKERRKKVNWSAKVLISFLLIIIGGLIGWNLKKPEYITETVVQIDTVYVKSEPIVRWKTAYINVTKNDTILITDIDTIYIEKNLQIASDTTYFDKDTLHTWYFFPPANRFKYNFYRAPQQIIKEIQTITIVEKPKWYQNPYLWGSAGLVAGVILGGR